MYETILFPVSGKKGLARAGEVLRHVTRIADGSTVVLLHVFDVVPLTVGGEAHAQIRAEHAATGETLLKSVGQELEKKGISFRCRVEEGTVAETIVRVAHEEKAELIVMLTDGRNGLPDYLLGSITERVLRNTDTALLAIRQSGGE